MKDGVRPGKLQDIVYHQVDRIHSEWWMQRQRVIQALGREHGRCLIRATIIILHCLFAKEVVGLVPLLSCGCYALMMLFGESAQHHHHCTLADSYDLSMLSQTIHEMRQKVASELLNGSPDMFDQGTQKLRCVFHSGLVQARKTGLLGGHSS